MTLDVCDALFPMNIELFILILFSEFNNYIAAPPADYPSYTRLYVLFMNYVLFISNVSYTLETKIPPVIDDVSSNIPSFSLK